MDRAEAKQLLQSANLNDPQHARRVQEALLVIDGCPAEQVESVIARRQQHRQPRSVGDGVVAKELRHEHFRISGSPDDQLLLALVICTGNRKGVGSIDFFEFLDEHRKPGSIHPNIDNTWSSPWEVQRALSRLRRRDLVVNGPLAPGDLSTWRLMSGGLEFLADRRLFEVTEQERSRRARQRRKAA